MTTGSRVLCRIELLGHVRVSHLPDRGAKPQEKATTSSVRSWRVAVLLARLACEPGRLFDRFDLADEIWGTWDQETETSDGREADNYRRLLENLKQAQRALRTQLETAGISADRLLDTTRTSLQLREGEVTTDVAELEAAWREARAASSAERLEYLEQVCNLYQGRFLRGPQLRRSNRASGDVASTNCGHYEPSWIGRKRGELEQIHQQALNLLIHDFLERGEVARAVDYAGHATLGDLSVVST